MTDAHICVLERERESEGGLHRGSGVEEKVKIIMKYS